MRCQTALEAGPKHSKAKECVLGRGPPLHRDNRRVNHTASQVIFDALRRAPGRPYFPFFVAAAAAVVPGTHLGHVSPERRPPFSRPSGHPTTHHERCARWWWRSGRDYQETTLGSPPPSRLPFPPSGDVCLRALFIESHDDSPNRNDLTAHRPHVYLLLSGRINESRSQPSPQPR